VSVSVLTLSSPDVSFTRDSSFKSFVTIANRDKARWWFIDHSVCELLIRSIPAFVPVFIRRNIRRCARTREGRGVNDIYSRSIKRDSEEPTDPRRDFDRVAQLPRLHSAHSRTHDARSLIPFSRNLAISPRFPDRNALAVHFCSATRVHRRSKSNNSRDPRGIRSHLPSRGYRFVLFASSYVRPRSGTNGQRRDNKANGHAHARDARCLNYKSREPRRESALLSRDASSVSALTKNSLQK